ncbi:hypothetical protein LW135_03835 [Helicobacter sp. faydin-H20]|uniref:hypothetical protein n=1 Tax=Helicobacter anatolicus TaxID=2905874 RepID=UPI001E2CF0E8|nr:hypothetical protein [Helicobacter anatolicus]MCE3036959.1 hypothetical protein [Helicobacter anatolicus]
MNIFLFSKDVMVIKIVKNAAKASNLSLQVFDSIDLAVLQEIPTQNTLVFFDDNLAHLTHVKDAAFSKVLIHKKISKPLQNFDHYVKKPFLPTQILELIRQYYQPGTSNTQKSLNTDSLDPNFDLPDHTKNTSSFLNTSSELQVFDKELEKSLNDLSEIFDKKENLDSDTMIFESKMHSSFDTDDFTLTQPKDSTTPSSIDQENHIDFSEELFTTHSQETTQSSTSKETLTISQPIENQEENSENDPSQNPIDSKKENEITDFDFLNLQQDLSNQKESSTSDSNSLEFTPPNTSDQEKELDDFFNALDTQNNPFDDDFLQDFNLTLSSTKTNTNDNLTPDDIAIKGTNSEVINIENTTEKIDIKDKDELLEDLHLSKDTSINDWDDIQKNDDFLEHLDSYLSNVSENYENTTQSSVLDLNQINEVKKLLEETQAPIDNNLTSIDKINTELSDFDFLKDFPENTESSQTLHTPATQSNNQTPYEDLDHLTETDFIQLFDKEQSEQSEQSEPLLNIHQFLAQKQFNYNEIDSLTLNENEISQTLQTSFDKPENIKTTKQPSIQELDTTQDAITTKDFVKLIKETPQEELENLLNNLNISINKNKEK